MFSNIDNIAKLVFMHVVDISNNLKTNSKWNCLNPCHIVFIVTDVAKITFLFTKQTVISTYFCLFNRLAMYVYEYLMHVGANSAAQVFLKEVFCSIFQYDVWSYKLNEDCLNDKKFE